MTTQPLNQNSLYTNQGNSSILPLLDENDYSILDVGCGAGDTGLLIRSIYPKAHITGITCSELEYKTAKERLDNCYCINLENSDFSSFSEGMFDVLCFVHVLEHLVDPATVIKKLLPYLRKHGKVIVALPNIANWRYRWKFLMGKFDYTDSGVMDKTHLHFYTYFTAPLYLINPISELEINYQGVSGSIPLGFFRHHILSQNFRKKLDQLGCSKKPNIFGSEILIKATKCK